MSDIIQLTETARLRVEQDLTPSNPRDDYTVVGFVKIGYRGDSRLSEVSPGPAPTARIAEAHDHFDNIYWRSQAGLWEQTGAPDPDELTERWAKIFHGLHVEYDAEHGGYWFLDEATYWGDVEHDAPNSLERQAEVIAEERESDRRWADGEVYGVIFERLATYMKQRVTRIEGGFEACAEEPRLTDEWEHVASLWGCYLDEEYTAQEVAKELDVEYTKEELVALDQ